jgi:predicted carbohydrate-binding protein with CBM5 and CBM33 domain
MAVRFSRRLSVVLLTLALAAGQAGVCAGWMATPEARMACCSEDGQTRIVTQAEADRCCAASEREDSAPSPAGPGIFVTLAVALSPIPGLLPAPEAHADIWRASVPIPTGHVPKHVLLSVFLV